MLRLDGNDFFGLIPAQSGHPWAVPALVLVLLLSGLPVGSAYHFYPTARARWDGKLARTTEDALRWKRSVWRPGADLVWHLVEDPDWRPTFAGAGEVRPHIQEALAAWSAIPTADLRLRLDGVVPHIDQDYRGRRDGTNTIFADGDGSRARLWLEWDGPRERWEITECDVSIATGAVAEIADPNLPGDGGLRHELGHCLGLAHSEGSPGLFPWQRDGDVGWQDPLMSKPVRARGIGADEELGVSLLRPAPGWLETTGKLAGRVMLEGRPAAMVSVHLLRHDGGRVRATGVQVFSSGPPDGALETEAHGVFLAEGLAPGDYLLWLRPVFLASSHGPVDSRRYETDLKDQTVPRVFRVEVGRETWAGEFAMERGRDPG